MTAEERPDRRVFWAVLMTAISVPGTVIQNGYGGDLVRIATLIMVGFVMWYLIGTVIRRFFMWIDDISKRRKERDRNLS